MPDSHCYGIYNTNHRLIGFIRALKWNSSDQLPMMKDFNVDLGRLISGLSPLPDEVWHIGRFVIDQQEIRHDEKLMHKRITILKLLLFCAFDHIAKAKNGIALAECDAKLFNKLKLMGIDSKIIGESQMYFGSETIPIYNTTSGVKDFVEANKNICYV
jgi:hypothetical protein